MEHEVQGRVVVVDQVEDQDVFDEEVFKKKVVEGYTKADAAIVAGYRGNNPAQYANRLAQVPEIKEDLEAMFERKARLALKYIKPKKMKGASVVQLATTAGIMARNAREERESSKPKKHLHLHVDLKDLPTDEIREYLTEKSRAFANGGE